MKIPCAFCEKPVDDTKPGSFIEVTGWAEVRSGGGAHAISMRRNLGRAAHGACIEMQKRGGEQMGLMGNAAPETDPGRFASGGR